MRRLEKLVSSVSQESLDGKIVLDRWEKEVYRARASWLIC